MKPRFNVAARKMREAAMDARNDRIKALHRQSVPAEQIAAEVGRSVHYVRRVAGKWEEASIGRDPSIHECRNAGWHFDEPAVAKSAFGTTQPELVIQKSILCGLPLIVPCLIAAVPNGIFTPSKAAQAKAKAEGVTTGYPDLIIDGIGPNAGRVCRAEIKSDSRVSRAQFDTLNRLHAAGHLCGVFRSVETLARFLEANGWKSRRAAA